MEFEKLSEVTLAENAADTANVMIEENGEIKRVPKNTIGAQADWNETDETNPAFILNKPQSMGGYTYYSYYGNHLYKSDGTYSLATEEPTRAEFEAEYMKNPIMLLGSLDLTVGSICPVLSYKLSGGNTPYIFTLVNGVNQSYTINFPS